MDSGHDGRMEAPAQRRPHGQGIRDGRSWPGLVTSGTYSSTSTSTYGTRPYGNVVLHRNVLVRTTGRKHVLLRRNHMPSLSELLLLFPRKAAHAATASWRRPACLLLT